MRILHETLQTRFDGLVTSLSRVIRGRLDGNLLDLLMGVRLDEPASRLHMLEYYCRYVEVG